MAGAPSEDLDQPGHPPSHFVCFVMRRLKYTWSRQDAGFSYNGHHGHQVFLQSLFESRHDKTNKMSVRLAKTQIILGIRPV